jgi:hypothetical protein
MPSGGSKGFAASPQRPNGPQRVFVGVMRVVSAAPLLIGAFHVVHGPAADAALGAIVTPELLADPALDSQARFYGAAFMGYGATLYVSLTDLARYAAVFRIVGGFLVLGGLARLLSVALSGVPGPPILALIGVELGLVPLVLWWHSRVLGRLRSSERAPAEQQGRAGGSRRA